MRGFLKTLFFTSASLDLGDIQGATVRSFTTRPGCLLTGVALQPLALPKTIEPSTISEPTSIPHYGQWNFVPTSVGRSDSSEYTATAQPSESWYDSTQVNTGEDMTGVLSWNRIGGTTGTSQNLSTPIVQETGIAETAVATADDLFAPIETGAPPEVFTKQANPLDLPEGVENDGKPYQTNKFYTNLIVGAQNSSAFVFPYSVWYNKTRQGIAISHTGKSRNISRSGTGDSPYGMIHPVGMAELVFSAAGFSGNQSQLNVKDMQTASCRLEMRAGEGDSYLELPLVQGMGWVTGIYHGDIRPVVQLPTGLKRLRAENPGSLPESVLKYRVTLLNGVEWLLYITFEDPKCWKDFDLTVKDRYTLEAAKSIDGVIIQAAVAPQDQKLEVHYDNSAGMYATSFNIKGSVKGTAAQYSFEYSTKGKSQCGQTILFALPHHVSMMTSAMDSKKTGIELEAYTKGTMRGFLANSLDFKAELDRKVSWLPYSPDVAQNNLTYGVEQLQLLADVANKELQVDISSSIKGLNTYFTGKMIDKFAYILLVVSDIIGHDEITHESLDNLKTAFELLLKNKQTFPLYYDTKFSGIVSSADWKDYHGQADFGATYYNDHHFHYGYLIHTAAVIAYIDSKLGGSWGKTNKAWVNALIRDVANPSQQDNYFPVFRSFDWYHGHSFASGLFENPNGRNQESSSEDYNFAYAMKMWGRAIGDLKMELRADIILAIMRESINKYYLYSEEDTIWPETIAKNKVPGLLFENSITYTTFFGNNTEYIHGINMLPITPVSGLIRKPNFVKEEWNEKISPILEKLESGWKGVVMLNQALYDPKESYNFFAAEGFDSEKYLDGGMSRTWALAFSGGLANTLGLL
ncbi:AaceriAGL208Cp [[Ashbya] aceris (nom. inval.)]|nr:AaceriAGL208Cp [[Ashbya] aceris (nom. inval.)]